MPIPLTVGAVVSTAQLCLLLVFVAALCLSSSLVSLCLVGRLSLQSGGNPGAIFVDTNSSRRNVHVARRQLV